jgi:hypothetical protein
MILKIIMFQYYKPFNHQRGVFLRSIGPHLQSFQQIGLFAKGVPLHVLLKFSGRDSLWIPNTEKLRASIVVV